jgi:hypothetical protein
VVSRELLERAGIRRQSLSVEFRQEGFTVFIELFSPWAIEA